jgi:hypothetical protein
MCFYKDAALGLAILLLGFLLASLTKRIARPWLGTGNIKKKLKNSARRQAHNSPPLAHQP